MQQRWQQHLLTCNTPSSKYHSWFFITFSVLTGKKKKNAFLKKTIYFFSQPFFSHFFQVWASCYFMLHNNLSTSLEGPLNCICTHVSIRVETYYILLNAKPKAKDKVLHPLKPKMVRKVHVQLHSVFPFCFIIITKLLPISSKSELQFTLRLF